MGGTLLLFMTAALHAHFLCVSQQNTLSKIYQRLHIGHWLGGLSKQHSRGELNTGLTERLNVYRSLITLRSRNPERGFFFFPTPSSFESSSPLLASTDFSESISASVSLTKSACSVPGFSVCWTEGPESAYALVFNNHTEKKQIKTWGAFLCLISRRFSIVILVNICVYVTDCVMQLCIHCSYGREWERLCAALCFAWLCKAGRSTMANSHLTIFLTKLKIGIIIINSWVCLGQAE